MVNPSVDLEWNGLRVVGSYALEVIKCFTVSGQKNGFSNPFGKSSTKKTLIVLDAQGLVHLNSMLDEERSNFLVILNAEDPELTQFSDLNPDGWISLSPLKDRQGAYLNSELNTVEVKWNDRVSRKITTLLSPDSSIQARVALTAAVFAQVINELIEGVNHA